MIIRRVFAKNLIRVNYHVSKTSGRFFSSKSGDKSPSSSSSSSDSDDEKTKATDSRSKKKPAVSSSRLNELLASMTVSDQRPLGKSIDVTPESLRKRKENQKSLKQRKLEDEKNLEKVAKNVAESIGGDARQTESELLKKLLDISTEASEVKVRIEQGEDSSKLNDIIVGMKVERTKKPPRPESEKIFRRGSQSRRTTEDSERPQRERMDRSQTPVPREYERINLWSGQRLNIFPPTVQESPDPLKVWCLLKNRDLEKVFETPPRNYFEKMQRWTAEGKIWHFPIDNEQGLEEEAKIYFAEHVFLEPHLEPWCPKSGPVRHFMELVCVGLSKNPYLTVKEKQDHIFWFRDYFESKKKLLQEIIVQDGEAQKGKSGQQKATK